MMYNNTLINAFRNNQGLLASQERISSGKRINRPSDDPTGIMEVLQFRTDIGKSDQYLGVMKNGESFLNSADSVLGAVHDGIKTAKEKALAEAGGLANSETRSTTAIVIDNMISQMTQLGNTRVGGRYLFSGQKSELPAIDANGGYGGSGKDLQAEISQGVTIPISVRASEFLTADMNPALSNSTLLSSLNGGTGLPADGVPPGQFTITDRVGGSATIDTSAMTTVGEVLTAINAAAGINVTASLSADGTAITLTDNNTAPANPPTQALAITEAGGGTTAAALGIAGTRNTSVFTGTDIDPAITDTTLIADLYGGNGMALSDISVLNGGASATVTFTGAITVGQVRAAINTAGAAMGLSANIDAAGRKLDLASASSATVSYALDIGTGTTAELLGIGGGRNIIPVLKMFSAALKANDAEGILGAVALLDTNMQTTSSVRGSVGSRVNQIVVTRNAEEQSKFDNTKIKSFVEDADYLEAASELAMLQTAYQATLKSAASIIQPSLLDFVR